MTSFIYRRLTRRRIPGGRAVDRAEVWATFVLVLVGGLVLLSLMGVLVGPFVDHAFGNLLHTLGSPLLGFR